MQMMKNVSAVVYEKNYVLQKQSSLIKKLEKNPLSLTKTNVSTVQYVKKLVLLPLSKQYVDLAATENTTQILLTLQLKETPSSTQNSVYSVDGVKAYVQLTLLNTKNHLKVLLKSTMKNVKLVELVQIFVDVTLQHSLYPPVLVQEWNMSLLTVTTV